MTDTCIEVLKILTTVSSVAMCFSPAPSTWRVFQRKSTGEVSVLPLASLWVNYHIWSVCMHACVPIPVVEAERCAPYSLILFANVPWCFI